MPPVPLSPTPAQLPARSATSGRPAASVIGQGLVIVGNLTSRNEVHIDGEVRGDVRGAQVLIGESARVEGNVIGEDIVIRGQVSGGVTGRKVALQASGRVEGDIHHQTLAIEQGAFFEGRSKRQDDPLAGLPLATS